MPRFLHEGRSYQVDAWGTPDDLASGVHTAGECQGAGGGTAHADGSTIDTSLFSRDGIEPCAGRIVVGALLAAVITAAIVARRRITHPRLTIDGQPRR